jgi:isocitrate/isopropylmalate dehydrogenase
MLGWLGEEEAKERVMKAVENVCGAGILTADLGGKANTKEVTTAICEELERLADK